ncbi:MAG: UbiA family prenyltransferase [Chlorobi bacterium]|nr:UbiA family prenyltransferase [Chlorobiota bacterium]
MTIKALCTLIRCTNLLFIALTMAMVKYLIIDPLLHAVLIQPLLTDYLFALLVLSVVLIAAGGYAINDYFDTGVDTVNKPERVVVGIALSRRKALLLHLTLTTLGILIGFYVAWKVGRPTLGFFHIISAGLLWFYSSSYKKTVFVGNVVISLLVALVILLPFFYEHQIYTQMIDPFGLLQHVYIIMTRVFVYAFFAFMLTLIREIVKDMEDASGDFQFGIRTMPVVIGITNTKWITGILIVATIFVLGKIIKYVWDTGNQTLAAYGVAAVLIPLFIALLMLIKAQTKQDFHRLSTLLKMIMFSGILSILVYYATFMGYIPTSL